MAQATPMNEILHSVLTKSRYKLVWAIMKNNALFAWAMARNRMEMVNGGYEISNPLVVGRNPNVSSYTYYDELPLAQTDEFDTVRYGWSRVQGAVIISEQEKDENKGESKIFDLVKTKLMVLETSLEEKFSEYLYGAGAGKDPNGLGNLIPADPTTGTLGGKDRATNPWWRTSAYDLAGGLNAGNIEAVMDDIQLDLTVKKKSPDLIIMGRDIYRIYKAAIREKFTIDLSSMLKTAPSARMVDLQFEGVKWGGKTIIMDQDCPVNQMFWINSEYLKVHTLSGVDFVTRKLTAPWNIEASGSRIVWQGQFCLWNAWRSHARVTN